MYESLIKYSLDSISSLEHYYEVEAQNILKISNNGKKQHKFGTMIDCYFRALFNENEQVRESKRFEEFEKRVLKHIDVVEKSEDDNYSKITYRYLSEHDAKKAGNIKEESRLFFQYAEMPTIHGNSVLMMLVTRFEEFISAYLSELYIRFPQRYLDNQQLSFSEISSANLQEIKENLVLREIDHKMRESYTEWFKIYKSHGMTCKLFESELCTLSEIYARRNIIVHNSGIVNTSYMHAVPDAKVKLGDTLSVDEEYMKTAFNTVYRIIILMLIESSKLNKENENNYLLNIFEVLFDLLLHKKYTVCEPAFAELAIKEALDSETKLMSKFNRWICLIAEKGLTEVETEIKAFDESALSDLFKLAKAILLNEYDIANILLKKLLTSDELSSTMIEEWPLFIWYRSSSQYETLKKDLPDKFGLEREEVSEQAHNTANDITLPKSDDIIGCL